MGSVSRSSNNIFQMPSWGSTKVMRCMKVHNTNPTPQPNSPTSPSSDQSLIARLGDNLHLPARKSPQFHDAVTQKSTLVFSLAADKMKSDFVPPKEGEKAPEKPWNLRARNPVKGNTPNSDHAVAKPPRAEARNSSPRLLRGSGGAAVSEGGVGAASTSSGVKRKFSISLSKEEIEEDFMAMTGRKLPRRPRKNPRNVQKFLDPLFPGQWLAEIDVDTYKVADDPGKGKVNVR